MTAEWRQCHWGDIATLQYGKGLRGYESAAGSYRVFGTNGPIGWHSEPLCEHSTVIVGRKGAYRGIHYSPMPCFVIDTAFYLSPKVEFDMRWAYYELLTHDINGMDSGSAIPSTSRDSFYHLPVVLPPLPAQRAIAHILGTLDDKIELNRRMNETLEAMARALFKSWFVDFDPVRAKVEGRDPGLPPHLAALFPNAFQDSEVGEIPEGWTVERLSNLMTFQGGTQPPASEFISEPRDGYVRLVQIRDFYTDIHLTYITDSPKLRKFTIDDIMLARYGSSGNAIARDSLGRVCRGLSGAYNVALVKVVPHQPCREFLYYFLKSEVFQSTIRGMGARSVQSGFRKEDLGVISVVTAPRPIHKSFEHFTERIWQKVYANGQQSRTLTAIRDALLPKLLSGEIRVKDAEKFVEEKV